VKYSGGYAKWISDPVVFSMIGSNSNAWFNSSSYVDQESMAEDLDHEDSLIDGGGLSS
jgi:hypothetical protein